MDIILIHTSASCELAISVNKPATDLECGEEEQRKMGGERG